MVGASDPGPSAEEAGLCATVSRGRAGGGRPLQGRCMVRARHGNGRTVPNGTQPTEIFGVCFNNSQNKDSPWGSRLWAVVVGSWSGGCDAAGSDWSWAQPTQKRELVVKAMKLESESRLLAETPGMEVLVGDDDTQFGSEDDCDQEDYQLVVNEFLKVMSTGEAGPPGYWYDVVWDFDIMTLQETLRLVGMGASPLEAVTEALLCTPQHMRPVEYQDPERDMIVKAIEMVQAKSEAADATARTMMNHETESQEEQLRGEVQTGVKCKTNEAAGNDNAKVWMVWATWPPNCWRGGRPCVLQDNEMHRDAELAASGEKHVANLLRDQVGAG